MILLEKAHLHFTLFEMTLSGVWLLHYLSFRVVSVYSLILIVNVTKEIATDSLISVESFMDQQFLLIWLSVERPFWGRSVLAEISGPLRSFKEELREK